MPSTRKLSRPLLSGPLLSVTAAAAVLVAVTGPASAATAAELDRPARGVAGSGVTLVGLAAGGHVLSAGSLELLSDALTATPVAQVVVTPLTVDGTAYGRQVVTPGDAVSSPSVDSAAVAPGVLSALLSARSPVLRAAAATEDGGASSQAGSASFGGVSLLGLPVALDGTLDVGSVVTGAGSLGEQVVALDQVALPSIADLLAALGLDLGLLPTDVLVELLEGLDLVDGTVATAQDALDAAQALLAAQTAAATAEVAAQLDAVEAATADLVAATAAADGLTGQLLDGAQAQQAADAAVAAADAVLAERTAAAAAARSVLTAAQAEVDRLSALPLAGPVLVATAAAALDAARMAVTEADALVVEAQTVVTTTVSAVGAADTAAELTAAALASARDAVALAQSVLDAANRLLDAAQAALAAIVSTLQPLVDALLSAVLAVLDGTPLVSLDGLSVVSRASATSDQPGGQDAEVVGGEVRGLRVLGTDVLQDVLGSSSVALTELTATQLDAVDEAVADLTGTLSSVLSSVPGFPTLSVPAPDVALLTSSTRTGAADGFGTAGTDLRALTITLPGLSVPTALAVPGAASLPALQGVTQVAGLLTSAPIALELADLGSSVRFSPALAAGAPGTGTPGTGTPGTGTPGTGTPGTGTPGTVALPRTGASQAVALLGLVLAGAAVAVRRRVA